MQEDVRGPGEIDDFVAAFFDSPDVVDGIVVCALSTTFGFRAAREGRDCVCRGVPVLHSQDGHPWHYSSENAYYNYYPITPNPLDAHQPPAPNIT